MTPELDEESGDCVVGITQSLHKVYIQTEGTALFNRNPVTPCSCKKSSRKNLDSRIICDYGKFNER